MLALLQVLQRLLSPHHNKNQSLKELIKEVRQCTQPQLRRNVRKLLQTLRRFMMVRKSDLAPYQDLLSSLLNNILDRVYKLEVKSLDRYMERFFQICKQEQYFFDLEVKATFISHREEVEDIKFFKICQLQREEVESIREQNVNQLVEKLTLQKAQLPDTQCLGCSKFFYEDWKASTLNNCEVPWKGTTFQSLSKNSEVLKCLCSLLNEGGGILIVGVNPETKKIQGRKGKLLNLQQMKKQWQSCLKPTNPTIQIDHVPVYSGPLSQKEGGSYVVRIKVFYQQSEKGPVKIQISGPKSTHQQCYEFDERGRAKKIFPIQQKTMIPYTKIHWGQDCIPPYKVQGQFQDEDYSFQDEVPVHPISIDFPFLKQFLVVADSQKLAEFQTLKEILNERKMIPFSIKKLLTEFEHPKGIELRILSIEHSHQKFKPFVKGLKLEIKLITKILKNVTKIPNQVRAKHEKQFKKYFPESQLKFSRYENNPIKFVFDDFNQSLFSFVVFESEGVKMNFQK